MIFKKGDLVRALEDHTEMSGDQVFTKGCLYIVSEDSHESVVSIERDDTGKPNGMYSLMQPFFERADKRYEDTMTLGAPQSIADDLRLKPQARKILSHLLKGLTISPLEAQNVYAVYRLAASIHELREAGYKIRTQNKHDQAGHKYARYSLDVR
jgi:Helix-turn-helix domain